MKILLTATHVPFVNGGAEAHMRALHEALLVAGHEVELMRVPFCFWPEAAVEQAMAFCERFDLERLSVPPDRVISLQFPAYGMRHPEQTVWLMHQHRAVYELYGDVVPKTEALAALREKVIAFDNQALRRAKRLFANSRRVAARLRRYNGLEAEPLYHPPPDAERFYAGEMWDYVLFPSRLENLKRQSLLIEAARYVKAPVRFVLLGEGGQRANLEAQIARLGLKDKVWLAGFCPRHEQIAWYAHALAVFFGPHDEDYGYVTLEAMLAARPVITCTDSGGPLEFVQDKITGLVVEPEPLAIASAIEALWADRPRAQKLGQAAREAILALDLRWEKVVERLLD
ncbi:glycosyltransferase family 4 protein [Methylothermus subterraneus]